MLRASRCWLVRRSWLLARYASVMSVQLKASTAPSAALTIEYQGLLQDLGVDRSCAKTRHLWLFEIFHYLCFQ